MGLRGPKPRIDDAKAISLNLDGPTRELLSKLAQDEKASQAEIARRAISTYSAEGRQVMWERMSRAREAIKSVVTEFENAFSLFTGTFHKGQKKLTDAEFEIGETLNTTLPQPAGPVAVPLEKRYGNSPLSPHGVLREMTTTPVQWLAKIRSLDPRLEPPRTIKAAAEAAGGIPQLIAHLETAASQKPGASAVAA